MSSLKAWVLVVRQQQAPCTRMPPVLGSIWERGITMWHLSIITCIMRPVAVLEGLNCGYSSSSSSHSCACLFFAVEERGPMKDGTLRIDHVNVMPAAAECVHVH
jgi:hypothetical protein